MQQLNLCLQHSNGRSMVVQNAYDKLREGIRGFKILHCLVNLDSQAVSKTNRLSSRTNV